MSLLDAPFLPTFGSGAPGANVPKNQPYFDNSTTPYTPYVFDPSPGVNAWKTYSVSGGAGNATSIQSIPVSTTPPSDGQVLVYQSSSGKYVPGSVSASTPTIIQVGTVCGTTGTVTMPSAPTNGNLLIAIVCDFAASAINGTGWNSIFNSTGSTDGFGYGWKIAGASEPTTQTPTTDVQSGVIAIWEISGAGNPGVYKTGSTAGASSFSVVPTTFIAKQLVVGVFDFIFAALPTSVTGVDHSTSSTGGSRGLTYFDVVENATGTHTITANYGSSHAIRAAAVIVGP